MVKFQLRGVEQMLRNMRRVADNMPRVIGRAMLHEAEIEMTESKKRVPVDTGTLKSSGHVVGPEYRGKNVRVLLTYGGLAEHYALQVHEDLDAFHRVGEARYLASVLEESAPHMMRRIAARANLRDLLGTAGGD